MRIGVFLEALNAVPCGSILDELAPNGSKHAFPGGHKGLITIGFRILKEKTYELTVQDNGIGPPKDDDTWKNQK
jgi:two-component system, sensor histidine kinase PdtaS